MTETTETQIVGRGDRRRIDRRRAELDERLPRDGRAARAVRTRHAVADALLDLIEEGHLRPTSKDIARRAGVSERTIFQHFDGLETLFSVAAHRVGARIQRDLVHVPADGPLAERLRAYLDDLTFLHESMTPIRRASRLHEPFSPTLDCALGILRKNIRRGVERVFAIEISRRPDEASRTDVVRALMVIVSWSSWENMRRNENMTVDEARRVLEVAIHAVLTAGPGDATETVRST